MQGVLGIPCSVMEGAVSHCQGTTYGCSAKRRETVTVWFAGTSSSNFREKNFIFYIFLLISVGF